MTTAIQYLQRRTAPFFPRVDSLLRRLTLLLLLIVVGESTGVWGWFFSAEWSTFGRMSFAASLGCGGGCGCAQEAQNEGRCCCVENRIERRKRDKKTQKVSCCGNVEVVLSEVSALCCPPGVDPKIALINSCCDQTVSDVVGARVPIRAAIHSDCGCGGDQVPTLFSSDPRAPWSTPRVVDMAGIVCVFETFSQDQPWNTFCPDPPPPKPLSV